MEKNARLCHNKNSQSQFAVFLFSVWLVYGTHKIESENVAPYFLRFCGVSHEKNKREGTFVPTVTYQCPACGAPLRFDAATQQWACDYCHANYTQQDLDHTSGGTEAAFHGVRYTCPTCGAELVADENTAATFCLYCHSPTLLSERLTDDFQPAGVIPFQITKEQAKESFLKWCRSRKFVPNSFKSRDQIEKMTGLYVPYWLFDGSVEGRIQGMATTVRSNRVGDTIVTRTRYYDVVRGGSMAFAGVPADGSKKLEDQTMKVLEPYDYKGMLAFYASYLAGFFAEKYDVDKKSVSSEVEARMRDYAEQLLRNTISGYATVNINWKDVRLGNTQARYVLMPVWLLTYRTKGKDYMFLMNGQTGKIAGDTPFSFPKLFRFGAVAWAAATVLLTIFGYFF